MKQKMHVCSEGEFGSHLARFLKDSRGNKVKDWSEVFCSLK